MLTVSLTSCISLVFSTYGVKYPFSIKLLSRSILTWASKSFDVQIIKLAWFFSLPFLRASKISWAKVMTQRIGVINSWETFEVSRLSKLFCYSAFWRLRCADMSLIDKIWQSLLLKIILWVLKWTVRLVPEPIDFKQTTRSPVSPNN